MRSRKIFYKYQSLKVATDENGNLINYTIKNLENNQLYFGYPPKFNDPFDCRIYVDNKAKEEQWISHFCDKYNRCNKI